MPSEGQSTQLAQLNAAHDCMMDLAKQMGSEGMDSIMVLKDTVTSFKKLLNCDRCSVFKLDKEQGTLELHSNELDSVIVMPIGAGIAGHCGQSGNLVNIPDAYADTRFNQAIDKKTGFKTKCQIRKSGVKMRKTGSRGLSENFPRTFRTPF